MNDTTNSPAVVMDEVVQPSPRSRRRLLEYAKDFTFAVPALLVLVIFLYYPLVNSFYLSFTNWNMTKPAKAFIGLDNYTYLLTSSMFYQVLRITFTYMILDVSLTLGIGLLLALLMNVSSRLFNFMRMLIFIPHYISVVIISMIFLWIFNTQFGLANEVLKLVGLTPIPWLNNPHAALWVLIIVAVWKGVGFTMIIFISGLRSIPLEYYEAASIDGSSKWNQLWHITLPLLSPTTLFLVVTHFISSMQVFQSVNVITGGGPLQATEVMVYWIYETAFTQFRTGRASALAIIFFIIIIFFTVLQLYVSKKKVHYEG
ncbi:carbohydrate ABC transporter permease [Paenibacillus cremeus]|uniref:Sugar ABC transporter permease n=1 Tax=Paenibacillus cremeus TaxID=2163881 RepID=A0A559JRB4_9BACL|nr:sugar ABC transporter permease [Paenibacillus cremeus]TVY02414.1 sugar ABC transporter permease [Paenibacillus cremeus]